MKAYSQDIRERVIEALEAGEESQREIAERFGVSVSFVKKLWRRWRKSGSYTRLPRGGGRQRQLKDYVHILLEEVEKQPDATLEELRDRIVAAGGPEVSVSTICRELQRLKLQLKKVTTRLGKRYAKGRAVKDRV